MAGSTTTSLTQEELDFLSQAVLSEKIQNKGVNKLDSFDSPALDYITGRTKEIAPPTKDAVKFLVKGRADRRIQWWDGADLLTFGNAPTLSNMTFGVGRGHMGIEVLYQALEYNGIKVKYSKDGIREGAAAPGDTLQVVANILSEEFDNAHDDWKRDMIRRFWRANTDQSKCFAGVDALFPASGNTTGTIGGRDRSNPMYRHNLITGLTKTNFQLGFHRLVKQANDFQRKGKVELFVVGDDVWDMIADLFSGTDTTAGKFDWRSTRDMAMKKGEKYNVALPQDCFMYEDAIIYRAKEFLQDLASEEPSASPVWSKRIYGFNPAHFGIATILDEEMVSHGMPYNQRLERTSMHGEYVVWTDHPRANFVGVMT